MLANFRGSIAFTAVCLALAALYGWSESHTVAGLLRELWTVTVLAVLEVSLSFDNAVVNATVLQDMDEIWRKRFLTWGMIFAVYGMYVAFPLAIVAVAAGLNPVEAVNLSLTQPEKYEAIVSSAHVGIAGFGGAFLSLVGFKFFFDSDKEVHWIGVIERRIAVLGALPAIEIGLLLLALWGISSQLPVEEGHTFVIAGILGIIAFIAVEAVGKALELREEHQRALGTVVRSGLGGFIYLNVLDASFSFDAVIGAFALSNNMIVIALGLSIGAMFVRSLTLLLVRKGTLAEYRYLEHGAFWAIIALGIIMLVSARYEVPESITGLIGAVMIAGSLAWSVRWKRHHPETAETVAPSAA